MTKLTDLQRLLLTTAAARTDDGSLLPPPEGVTTPMAALRMSIASLLKRELVAEHETTDTVGFWREEGATRFGVVITEAGLAAIAGPAVEPVGPTEPVEPPTSAEEPAITDGEAIAPKKRQTKAAWVIVMLEREQGATLAELVEATGWLPHTTRAALTGLRKKGHVIDKATRDGVTCYSIVKAG